MLAGRRLAWGQEQRADKVFHVSPFCDVDGTYRFRFMRTDLHAGERGRVVVRIDHDDAHGRLLATSVSGVSTPLTPSGLRSVMWRMPLAVLGVMLRIHWQAFRLWLKGVPWFAKPAAPPAAITR
jgi:DUF1365 family protein